MSPKVMSSNRRAHVTPQPAWQIQADIIDAYCMLERPRRRKRDTFTVCIVAESENRRQFAAELEDGWIGAALRRWCSPMIAPPEMGLPDRTTKAQSRGARKGFRVGSGYRYASSMLLDVILTGRPAEADNNFVCHMARLVFITKTGATEGCNMIGWIVRIVMAMAGVITGWFVARDAINFGLLQMVVSILLMTVFIAVAAFWPSLWTWLRNSQKSDGRKCS